jgi:TrmH family RNA methyltransferase
VRAIGQIVRSAPGAIVELVALESADAQTSIAASCPMRTITDVQLRAVCSAQTPTGPLAVVRLPANVYSDELPVSPGNRVLLLEHIQDPGNVGTLIRTASALGFSGVILSSESADPFAPKAVAASAGTVLSVWIRRTPSYRDMAAALRQRGFHLAATDMDGTSPLSVLRAPRVVLALGNEGKGLSQELLAQADAVVRVPIDEEKAESLNVAATGAICMFAAMSEGPQKRPAST